MVIVIGVGAVGHMLVPASIGALGACLLVILAGVLLRRPLAILGLAGALLLLSRISVSLARHAARP